MSGCKYQPGQVFPIGIFEGDGETRSMVVREARVMRTESRFHGNSSRIFLSVAHDDCYEDMQVSTTTLTALIRNAKG